MSNYPDFSKFGCKAVRELGRNREAGRITYLATTLKTNRQVVIKEFRFASAGADWSVFKAYKREIEVLQQLNHPRIPRYLGSFETPSGFCLVQEYKNAPSLVKRHSFNPEEIKQISMSVLEILVYIQKRTPPVIHRDIKPENILVDNQLNAYLIDFGFARIRSGELALSSVATGTIGFMPPEEQFGRSLTEASDLYSLGATLICLLTGTHSVDIGKLIDDNYRFAFKKLVPRLNPRFVEWLTKMVEPNVKNRYANAAVALEALKPIDVVGGATLLNSLFLRQVLIGLGVAAATSAAVVHSINVNKPFSTSSASLPIVEPSPTPLVSPPVVARPSIPASVNPPVIEQPLPSSKPSQSPSLRSPIISFNFRVIDAEYSPTLNRIVIVSDNPNQLHIYDPFWKKDVKVDLAYPPTSVSVGPDGKFAAVGHDAKISYVDLQRGQVVKVLDVTTNVFDVILAGNGWVYASPLRDQWEHLRAVEITTNNEVQSSGNSIYAGTVYKLHPNAQSLYGANRGLSPDDIEKINISQGLPVYAYDSPYHGDHPMCGNLWISEDGQRIFTACGNVFRASSNREHDITYNGSLSRLKFIQHLVHSRSAGRILAIPGTKRYSLNEGLPENQIAIFKYENLNTEKIVAMPNFIVNSKPYAANGRFVFVNSKGSQYYVIVQAEQSSGLLNDFGLVIGNF